MTWRLPDTYHSAGNGQGTATLKFYEGRDNLQSLRVTNKQQISDRYNAAITNLASRSIDIRLGGIYALQSVMQDSPRDQPTVIAVLCAFVRDRTVPARKPHKPPASRPPTDVQAAVTVVGTRNLANDGGPTVPDLNHTQLARSVQ